MKQLSQDRKLIRCAIYTRKSTEEGLEQEFNSLDAQRVSGEAFIQSQAPEGWRCLATRYDDGGFTGGRLTGLVLAVFFVVLSWAVGKRFFLAMIVLLLGITLLANLLAKQDMSYLEGAHKQGNC
jgi:hypothetical protein